MIANSKADARLYISSVHAHTETNTQRWGDREKEREREAGRERERFKSRKNKYTYMYAERKYISKNAQTHLLKIKKLKQQNHT